jgi:hypothetical protein
VPRPDLEVADLLRGLLRQGRLRTASSAQEKVAKALMACRTAELGGHADVCDTCGHEEISYNSCRNRHCPKCQGAATAAWLESQQANLLPVSYAHVVFTVPALLGPVALQNPRVVYGLLFRAVSQTLLQVAATPRHLGAQIGFLAILHTWGQNLMHHPHLHCVVPAGGISLDGESWVDCKNGFFLPVRVLSRLYRGKLLALLENAYATGKLQLHGELERLHDPGSFQRLIAEAWRVEWVVYAKPPFGGAEAVLRYLARYTHRVAISNRRILEVSDDHVRFTWKDYRSGGQKRVMRLETTEFVRRFLLHVLPRRFVKIRYYGFLAQSQRSTALRRSRELLGASTQASAEDSPVNNGCSTPSPEADGPTVAVCPQCKVGKLTIHRALPAYADSS